MTELAETVAKELSKQPDQGESLALWREIWKRYDREGLEAVRAYLDELLDLPGGL